MHDTHTPIARLEEVDWERREQMTECDQFFNATSTLDDFFFFFDKTDNKGEGEGNKTLFRTAAKEDVFYEAR